MKILKLLFFSFLILNSCQSQDTKLLIGTQPITDFSKYPIYPRLVEEVNGKVQWKESFQYLDSIEISIMTYLSNGLKVNGYIIKPKKSGNYPCIIFNRGGSIKTKPLVVASAAMNLGRIANNGYIVIASQYRGNAKSEGKEEFGGKDVNDVLNLFKVLEEVEGADTSRIGMYGWSRGGMMTYLAMTKTNKIKAAAVGGALADAFANVEDRPEMETNVYAELIPDYEKNKEAELTKRSAVKWANKFSKDVPILLMHGTSDWRVKPDQSLRLALEFDKERIPYRLIMYEGDDHSISGHRKETFQEVIQWFDRFVKNKETVPNMEYHGR